MVCSRKTSEYNQNFFCILKILFSTVYLYNIWKEIFRIEKDEVTSDNCFRTIKMRIIQRVNKK